MDMALLPLETVTAERLASLCNAEERARIGEIRNQPMRKRKLASAALSRLFLASRLGGDAADWAVRPDAAGAPRAFHRDRLMPVHMSRSHSAGFAAVAISTTAPLGIDVEMIAPHVSDPGFADHWFSSEERAFLDGAGTDKADYARRFFRLWTLKEAYLKARGLGFALPPDSISVARADAMPFFRLPPGETHVWTFASHRLGSDHCLSIVHRAADIALALHDTELANGAFTFTPAGSLRSVSLRLADTRTFHAHPEPRNVFPRFPAAEEAR